MSADRKTVFYSSKDRDISVLGPDIKGEIRAVTKQYFAPAVAVAREIKKGFRTVTRGSRSGRFSEHKSK